MKKFGAKKIAALALAMAIVTVGGVYATWSFSSDTKASGGGTLSIGVDTYNTVSGTSSGQYNITTSAGSGTKIYTVDQYSDAIKYITEGYYLSDNTAKYDYVIVYDSTGVLYTLSSSTKSDDYPSNIDDHTAALCIAKDASITITFTANTSIISAVNYGVDTQFSFSWYSGSTPQLNVDSSTHLYSAAGDATDVLELDDEIYTIYTTDSDAGRKWSTTSTGTFEYVISSADIATYLSMGAYIIIDNTTAWAALNNALNGEQVYLNIYEAGDPLVQPTVAVNTTDSKITLTDGTNSSSDVACYYVGFMASATDYNSVCYATVDCDSLGTALDISDLMKDVSGTAFSADSTYYIRVRAVANTSSGAANSTWTTAEYYITTDSSGHLNTVTKI